VAFILAQRNLPELDLVGYSWGTAIAGQLAGEAPDRIRRLVLAGPLWLREGGATAAPDAKLGAYRTVDAAGIIRRWTTGRDAHERAVIAPAQRLERWADAAVASDPRSAIQDPPRLRAPAGVVKDVQEYWLRGQPTYDPGRIRCPTQIVVGEWDRETTPEQGQALFKQLTGSAERRYTVIGGGTHSLLLENQRHQLYDVARAFLT
jgi:pimeloyl-ACP methyl ester carboxylesterase